MKHRFTSSKKREAKAIECANELIEQFNAAGNESITVNLDDLQKERFMQNERHGMRDLHKHFGNDVVMIGTQSEASERQLLRVEELLQGEIYAEVFSIGGYGVRSAERIYTREEDAYEDVPADDDETEYYLKSANRKRGANDISFHSVLNVTFKNQSRIAHEISARWEGGATTTPAAEFQYICRATHAFSYRWQEQIGCICSAKIRSMNLGEDVCLFVMNQFLGDSHTDHTWYMLTSGGKLERFKSRE